MVSSVINGVFVSLLEREAIKYEKDGFKIEAKRTLKYGSRILLKKKSYVIQTHYVYLYYTTDFTTDSVRECLKDYVKIYDGLGMIAPDSFRGFYFCSSDFDKKLFSDLRQALVKNEENRKNMKVNKLGKERLVEKEQPKKGTEKASADSSEILARIKKFTSHKTPKTEKDLDNMLVHYLSAFYPDINTQVAYQNAKIDAQISGVGIEIKFQPSSSELDRLYGQVEKYLKYLEKVIVVIGYEKSRELTETFEKRIKERGWLNSKVFVVPIR
jgi:hypothetical protein